MQLQHALLEIAEIRERVAATQVFRGYRAHAAALSALLAFLAAGLQPWGLAEPTRHLHAYVLLWSAVAGLSVAANAVDLLTRWLRDPTGREGARTLTALRALAPSLLTGGLATAVITLKAPEVGWTLPAIWALLFAQGIFASASFLPRGTWWIGAYYVVAGLFVLTWARDSQALAGWTMAITFGVGQSLAAGVLYFSLERRCAV